MSYSVERLLVAAITFPAHAIQVLERVTRPPQLGHDTDEILDGAEALNAYEAEHDGIEAEDEPLNPCEPGLSDDELVAVRQLIEERFPVLAMDARADSQDAAMWRAAVGTETCRGFGCDSPAGHAGDHDSGSLAEQLARQSVKNSSAVGPTADGASTSRGGTPVEACPGSDLTQSPRVSESGHPNHPPSDDPIEVFDWFVRKRTDPALHAHFADCDDNDAEYVRRAIRAATDRFSGLGGGPW